MRADQFDCDFVIGADGINSLVRKKIFFDKPPNFLKQVAYRTLIPSKKLPEFFSEDKTLLFSVQVNMLFHILLKINL